MVMASLNNSFAKEMSIRKRIASIFNKREDDFPSLRDYNDYLEEVEDLTFNLIEGIDVPAIEAKIAKYQDENAEQIINARARKAEELATALEDSKKVPVHPDASNGDTTQSSQVDESVGGQMPYAPTTAGVAFGQPRPTGMVPQPGPVGGGMDMLDFSTDTEEMMKIRAERGARAGGWSLDLSRKRSMEEAFGRYGSRRDLNEIGFCRMYSKSSSVQPSTWISVVSSQLLSMAAFPNIVNLLEPADTLYGITIERKSSRSFAIRRTDELSMIEDIKSIELQEY